MNNIDQLLEQIENLTPTNFRKLTKKYLDKLNFKQKQEFHLNFPNLELDKCSKIDCINQSFYYYKFSSQAHSYEFEINESNKKYSFQFYIDDKLKWNTKKITEKKLFVDGEIDIKTYYDGNDNQIDITSNDLHDIINWLFLHKKFIYNV